MVPVSDGIPRQPDLTEARASVLAIVAGSPMAHAPRVDAPAPLRALPPEVEAKLADRVDSQAAPAGGPGAHVVRGVVGPSALLAVLDAIGVVVGIAYGHFVLAALAAVLFVPLAAVALLGARIAARGHDRLTLADRRAISAASRWESRQSWTGPLATCRERGLVIAAARAAERIARSPGWRSGRIDEQRVRLDLGAELDQIDDQAHRIAAARHEHGAVPPGGAPVLDAAWETTLNRVAALTAYAGRLDGLEQRRAAALTAEGDPVRDEDLLAGAARDEFAMQELTALMIYLTANRGDPLGNP
jgi:hypothetical protein